MTGGMAILITCLTCKHFHSIEPRRGWCTILGTVFNDHKCREWQASKRAVADAFRMAQINPVVKKDLTTESEVDK